MTEQRIERQPKDHKVRNAGIGTGILLAGVLAGGALSGAFKGESANTANNPTQGPATIELATPRPSEAAGTPEPTKAPEVNIQNFAVEKLGTFEVLPGDMISGDVAMSDSKDSAIFPLYDQDTHKAADVQDNTKTALYIDVQAPGVVHAEWGATVTRGLTAEKKAEMLKLQAISKERAGFSKVDVVIWTGYETTVDEAGFKATGEQTSSVTPVTPSENGTEYNLEGLNNQDKLRIILKLFADGTVDADSKEGKVLMDVLINCLCGCQAPTETPKPTPTPTTTPEACVNPSFKDHVMKAGDTYKVPAGVDFIAQGDVAIDGKATYDNAEATGAVSVITDQKANSIKAPWGADIQVFDCATDEFINETYRLDVEQLKATTYTDKEGKTHFRKLDPNSINQLK